MMTRLARRSRGVEYGLFRGGRERAQTGVRSEATRQSTQVGRTMDIGTGSERRRECSVKKVKSLLK
jgi:hypothetical protein